MIFVRPSWLRDLGQDVFYGLRMLRRSPGVAAVAALSVALGIGANTAVFSVVNGFQRPLPVRSPEQLVVLAADTKGDETGFQYEFSYPALQDFRRQSSQLSDVFAFSLDIRGFSTGTRSTQFLYSEVTGNFFSALGVNPALGRLFQPGEGEHAESPKIVVLGY